MLAVGVDHAPLALGGRREHRGLASRGSCRPWRSSAAPPVRGRRPAAGSPARTTPRSIRPKEIAGSRSATARDGAGRARNRAAVSPTAARTRRSCCDIGKPPWVGGASLDRYGPGARGRDLPRDHLHGKDSPTSHPGDPPLPQRENPGGQPGPPLSQIRQRQNDKRNDSPLENDKTARLQDCKRELQLLPFKEKLPSTPRRQSKLQRIGAPSPLRCRPAAPFSGSDAVQCRVGKL